MPIRLSEDSREPIYHQIEEQMKAIIASGQLTAGTLLPSIRSLSKDLEISVITTRRAYQNLEYAGFIRTIQGKGTFVAELEEKLKKQVKVSAVVQAFERAIETAQRHDYTVRQIEDIFHEIISCYQNKEMGE